MQVNTHASPSFYPRLCSFLLGNTFKNYKPLPFRISFCGRRFDDWVLSHQRILFSDWFYSTLTEHPAGNWRLKLCGPDFRLLLEDRPVAEISFLPNADDFLLMYIDEELIKQVLNLKESLAAEIKASRLHLARDEE